MAIVRTDDKHYKAIADAIREYADMEISDSSTMRPEDMPNAIQLVKNNGYKIGFGDGGNEGFNVGYDEGRYIGKDTIWESLQNNGNRVYYNYAFIDNWTKESFTPKYHIRPTNAYRMFWNCQIEDDLVEILEAHGVELDFSQTGNENNYIFASAKFTRVGVINTTSMNGLNQTFMNTQKLITIDKLILKDDGSQTFTATFTGAWALENIVIEGKIGNNFTINNSPKLTHDSLMSIINALYDYSGTSTTKTLSIGASNLEKLTEVEKKIATDKGWSLV